MIDTSRALEYNKGASHSIGDFAFYNADFAASCTIEYLRTFCAHLGKSPAVRSSEITKWAQRV